MVPVGGAVVCGPNPAFIEQARSGVFLCRFVFFQVDSGGFGSVFWSVFGAFLTGFLWVLVVLVDFGGFSVGFRVGGSKVFFGGFSKTRAVFTVCFVSVSTRRSFVVCASYDDDLTLAHFI